MTVLQIAERLARAAHAGQRDLVGEYHLHLERVVAQVTGDEAQAVAWLHDILEDTPTTVEDLQAAGISEPVIDAVRILTRGVEPYMTYIKDIRDERNPLAIAVKIADLLDHIRPLDPPVLSHNRLRHYRRALAALRGDNAPG